MHCCETFPDFDKDRPLWFVKPFVEDRSLYAALLKLHRLFENDPDPLESESGLVRSLASGPAFFIAVEARVS